MYSQRRSERTPAGNRESPWKTPPVGVETFAVEFLRRRHSKPQMDFLKAVIGDHLAWQPEYQTFAACVGMGGGKNFTVETLTVYEDYRLMCLRNPQMFFWGLDESRFIDILNFSFVNETQAKEVFFDNVKNVIRSCTDPDTGQNWFESHGVDIRDRGIGDIHEKTIKLPHGVRNRCIVATREGFQGSNILDAIFDEPSRAVDSPPKNETCHKLYRDVLSNTETRFGNQAKVICFSYPESVDDDLIMELVAQAEAEKKAHEAGGAKPRVFAVKAATYEWNPLRPESTFDNQRLTDPDGYECRICCNPPKSRTGFYKDYPDLLVASFNRKLLPVVVYETYPLTRQVPQVDGTIFEQTYTAIRLVEARGDSQWRALGGDPGLSGDAFALAMGHAIPAGKVIVLTVERERTVKVKDATGHLQSRTVAEDGRVVDVERTETYEKDLVTRTVDQRPVVDMLVQIKPIQVREGKAYKTFPVDYISVKDFILRLKQYFPNLVAAAFDKWNSAQLIQELVRARIRAVDLVASNPQQLRMYKQHRGLVWSGMVDVVWQVPAAETAQREFEELQLLNNNKVDHRAGGSKDVSDAIVICVDQLLGLGGQPQGRILY